MHKRRDVLILKLKNVFFLCYVVCMCVVARVPQHECEGQRTVCSLRARLGSPGMAAGTCAALYPGPLGEQPVSPTSESSLQAPMVLRQDLI